MLNLIIFGPPGAGKGTQSEKLIEKYGLVHISTGDLFRAHKEKKTALGLKMMEYMDQGLLCPDSVTIEMLQEEVNKNPQAKGFLFDGFPRTVPQAEALDEFTKANNSTIHAVIALDVNEAELRTRIEKRRQESNRVDDDAKNVDRRVNEYFSKTIHVLPYYEQQGKLTKLNGIGKIEDIFNNITEIIDKVVA